MTATGDNILAQNHQGFEKVLVSEKPSADLGDAANVYGWLVGGWKMRIVDYADGGSKREQDGEWHFAWVLEGRAIQDVLVVPTGKRNASMEKAGNRYGCSLRVYDEELGAWKVRWNNPVTGAEDNLIGRRVGERIVQEGSDKSGNKIRWNFDDIKPDSFHWTGERLYDGGKTWKFEVEFFGERMKR